MTAEQKACDDMELRILLTDFGCRWRAVVSHNKTGNRVLVTLTPSADQGYWHIEVTDPAAGDAVSTKRPVSPYGVGLFLPEMGVDLPANWERVRLKAHA